MISVALCTYNGEKYISQQLDSIFSQSIPVDEIVICDDCSEDSTCNILESYAARYPQIRLIKNEINLGFRKNFEKALTECQGDYIFFSDQDDIWDKDKVWICVSYLKETGKYGVYTDGLLIDQNGAYLNETMFSRLMLNPYIEHNILDNHELELLCLRGNHVTGATLAVTKSSKDLLLPFRTSEHFIHDMWIAVKLSSINKLGRIDKPLISYRLHSNQQCGLNKDNINDILIDCFDKKGKCVNLRILRKYSILPIYNFKLNWREHLRIFSFYRSLYIKNLSGNSICIDLFKFIYTEFVVRVKCLFGFRVYR